MDWVVLGWLVGCTGGPVQSGQPADGAAEQAPLEALDDPGVSSGGPTPGAVVGDPRQARAERDRKYPLPDPQPVDPSVATLCEAGETVRFACTAQASGKLISLCASDASGDLQLVYRFGRPGKVELAFPDPAAPAKGRFTFAFMEHSASASYFVRFEREGWAYELFDQWTHGTSNQNGAGVTVSGPARERMSVACDPDQASVMDIGRLEDALGDTP